MKNTVVSSFIMLVTISLGVVSTAPSALSQDESNNIMFWWEELGRYMMETKQHLNQSHLYIPTTDHCEYYPRFRGLPKSVQMLIVQFYLRYKT